MTFALDNAPETVAAYAAYLRGLPPPLRQPDPDGPQGDYVQLLGQVEADVLRQGYRQVFRWLASTADEAGLEQLGLSRMLRRWPHEPLETYRNRVMGAFDFWEMAGTIPGVTLALQQAGYRSVITEYFGDDAHWADFSIAVSPANPLPGPKWGSGAKWGSGSKWGVDPNAVPTQYLTELIREAKPAHARLVRLLYFPRGRFWGSGTVRWGEGQMVLEEPLGYGLDYGLPLYPHTSSDSGPKWGAEKAVVLFDLED